MRKRWSKRVEADLEAEYMLPLPAIVRGFFEDGESLSTTASILEVSDADLRAFCARAGIQVRSSRRCRLVMRVESPTRARSVRSFRWDHDRISFARLESILGIGREALRKRWARSGGNLLRAITQ